MGEAVTRLEQIKKDKDWYRGVLDENEYVAHRSIGELKELEKQGIPIDWSEIENSPHCAYAMMAFEKTQNWEKAKLHSHKDVIWEGYCRTYDWEGAKKLSWLAVWQLKEICENTGDWKFGLNRYEKGSIYAPWFKLLCHAKLEMGIYLDAMDLESLLEVTNLERL